MHVPAVVQRRCDVIRKRTWTTPAMAPNLAMNDAPVNAKSLSHCPTRVIVLERSYQLPSIIQPRVPFQGKYFHEVFLD